MSVYSIQVANKTKEVETVAMSSRSQDGQITALLPLNITCITRILGLEFSISYLRKVHISRFKVKLLEYSQKFTYSINNQNKS